MQSARSVLYCHLWLSAKSHKNIYFRTVNRHADKLLINTFRGNGGRTVISIQLPRVPKNPPPSRQQARLSGATSAFCTNANACFLKAMQSFSPYHSGTTFTCFAHEVYFFHDVNNFFINKNYVSATFPENGHASRSYLSV